MQLYDSLIVLSQSKKHSFFFTLSLGCKLMLFYLQLKRLDVPLVLFRDILYLSVMHFLIDPYFLLQQFYLLMMLLQIIAFIVILRSPSPIMLVLLCQCIEHLNPIIEFILKGILTDRSTLIQVTLIVKIP